MLKRKGLAIKRFVGWTLILNLLLPPWSLIAAERYMPGMGFVSRNLTAPAANQLPIPLAIDPTEAFLEKPSEGQLVVHQQKDKAILEWQSFDIGADAETHFDQKGRTDWAALNRIYDQNPSQIFGRLSADGKIFLINQNGMIFGPDSHIQAHDIVASALYMRDRDFLDGDYKFTSEDYIGNSENTDWQVAVVENQGDIEVDRTGTVYLLAPNVKNTGTIKAPAGHILLVGAEDAKLDYGSSDTDTTREPDWPPKKTTPGASSEVVNQGTLESEVGKVSLFGRVINQEGIIQSTATVSSNGEIWLIASEKVTTGVDSEILCDISESPETLNRKADKFNGIVNIQAPVIEHKGSIVAPSGMVTLTAKSPSNRSDGAEAATPRIYLGEKSVIDVSGLEVDLPAEARLATVQLNSIQLRDDYGQKNDDSIVKGQTIAFDARKGSAIGNVSEAIDTQLQTARQKNVAGGTITLDASEGEVIQCQGASLAFSGGRTNYAAGGLSTTSLVAGRKIYDISDAPQWLRYDRIVGDYEKRYERFGIVKRFDEGRYFGGGAVVSHSSAYSEGADGGVLNLFAGRLVLDGDLTGFTYVGPYQTQDDENLNLDEKPITSGRRCPVGTSISMGNERNVRNDNLLVRDVLLNEVLITSDAPTLSAYLENAEDPLPDANQFSKEALRTDASLISADLLNRSGVENVKVYANYRISTGQSTDLTLPVGGIFSATARNIEHQGSITVPAGRVYLTAQAMASSEYTNNPLADDGFNEGLFIGGESLIDVAGQQKAYNNSLLLDDPTVPMHPKQANGGEIQLIAANNVSSAGMTSLSRLINGVMVAEGARLDVSGGYTVSAKGDVTGGDAGTLSLAGHTLVLDGDIQGLSLPGAGGGELILHASSVTVQAQAADTVDFDDTWTLEDRERVGRLILSPEELTATGFSKINIKSREDMTVSGVVLSPSYAKRRSPQKTFSGRILQAYDQPSTLAQGQTESVVLLSSERITDGKISLSAGELWSDVDSVDDNNKTLSVNSDALLSTSVMGNITLTAPNVVLAGELLSHGGDITVEASNTGSLVLEGTARLDVSGTLIPDTSGSYQGTAGLWTAVDAGSISLTGGDIDLQSDSQIDLSGSRPAAYYLRSEDLSLTTAVAAGETGSLSMAFTDGLHMDGVVQTRRYIEGQKGAELSIYRLNPDEGLTVNELGLRQALSPAKGGTPGFITLVDSDGNDKLARFDALTLHSDHSLIFDGNLDLQLGRRLTLDAPVIASGGSEPLSVDLKATWITLTNSYFEVQDSIDSRIDNSQITLHATNGSNSGWFDVAGDIGVAGFETVTLRSEGDMVLADRGDYLGPGGVKIVSGALRTAGDLVLQADQIYPETATDFLVAAPERIYIDRNRDTAPVNAYVYSAGGRLELQSANIVHLGRLLAPSGEIVMANGTETRTVGGVTTTEYTPAERVYLASDSEVSTRDAAFKVNYGSVYGEDDSAWELIDKNGNVVLATVTAAPEKQVRISATEIIQQPKAEINTSGGGGEVFAYGWVRGMEGSTDPLDLVATGRMVILPGAQTALPGEAIYLNGGAGLAEGVYTLLPAEYAFLPGAMILEDRGASRTAGFSGRTEEGYATVQGYFTEAGLGAHSGRLTDFAVRSAESVRAEGHYTEASMPTGDGGLASLSGDTVILLGAIEGRAVDDTFDGGILELSGQNISFKAFNENEKAEVLPADFDALSRIDDTELVGTLSVEAQGLSDGGFELIRIGDVTTTSYMEDGITRTAYTGTRSINIYAGTQLQALNLELSATDSITIGERIEGADTGVGTFLEATGVQGSLTLRCVDGTVKRTHDDGTVSYESVNGKVKLDSRATLQAVDSLVFDAPDLTLDGGLNVQHSTIALHGRQINFADDAFGRDGLTITPALWRQINSSEKVELKSTSDIYFDPGTGDTQLWQAEATSLSIDAQRLINAAGQGADVTVRAQYIDLLNSGDETQTNASDVVSGGSLTLAADSLKVGHGHLHIDGFDTISLSADSASSSNITFLGAGSLSTQADLILTADAVRTDLFRVPAENDILQLEAANFNISAGNRLSVKPASGVAVTDYSGLPGGLTMAADGIEISSAMILPGGRLRLSSRNDGILLTRSDSFDTGAEIHLAGNDRFAAGSLELVDSGSGSVNIQSDTKIDLSPGQPGAPGGSLEITVEGGDVSLEGDLIAKTENEAGPGGSFSLDMAGNLSNLDVLLSDLQDAGFTRRISVKSRSADGLTLGSTNNVAINAEHIRLSAAGGVLNIGDATQPANTVSIAAQGEEDGGLIELLSQGDLTIAPNVDLNANAPIEGGEGGRVYVASSQGVIHQAGNIGVKSGDDVSRGGTVHFRAQRNDEDNSLAMQLAGTISGADRVIAEAVRIYDDSALDTLPLQDPSVDQESPAADLEAGVLTVAEIESALDEAGAFISNTQWGAQIIDDDGETVPVMLVPGIEFQSDGNLTLNGESVDLSGRRFQQTMGAEYVAGTLALRAAGRLYIQTDMVDDPASVVGLDEDDWISEYYDADNQIDATGGWDIYLTAGADLDAVDPSATDSQSEAALNFYQIGTDTQGIAIHEPVRVYTQAGDIHFASSGDTVLINPVSTASGMLIGTEEIPDEFSEGTITAAYTISGTECSLASNKGNIHARVDGDLLLRQGIIQTGTGNIDIVVGNDLLFTNAEGRTSSNVAGAIRSTGSIPYGVSRNSWWDFEEGGDITIQTGGRIDGSGLLGALNGKALTPWDMMIMDDVDETVGHLTADYETGAQGIAAMAGGDVYVQSGSDIVCQVGTFRKGDLEVVSGGDMDGRYLVSQGGANLTALGNIGLGKRQTTLELGEADTFSATAVGSMEVDAIVNSTMVERASYDKLHTTFLTYGEESAVELKALEGDINLLGGNGYFSSGSRILPPIVKLAAGDGINVLNEFSMASSPMGRLSLRAGGTISGRGPVEGTAVGAINMEMDYDYDVDDVGAEMGKEPMVITAGEDIETLTLSLARQALICAANDIIDLKYYGQNLDDDDFSLIHAGNDILQKGLTGGTANIEQGGGGTLLVQAGRSIDLGTSLGIQAVGNEYNSDLPGQSSELLVVSGYDLLESFTGETPLIEEKIADPWSSFSDQFEDSVGVTAGMMVFFDQLRDAGRIYSDLLAEERKNEAEAFVTRFRENVIYPRFALLDDSAVEIDGDLNMINSKIKTVDDSLGIYIITRGDLNVGRSTLPDPTLSADLLPESGILTQSGGSINIFAAGKERVEGGESLAGDINVNESRVMTFLGGDITVWADQGDINAGRGSKGALILPEPEVEEIGDSKVVRYVPPIQGSGIRTLTYDPDGASGPEEPAIPGDGYIFAPAGEIDAGEAGISVENIYLAAVTYANVQNIEVSGASVGLPTMTETAPSMDAVGGEGSITDSVNEATKEVTGSSKERFKEALKSINENLVQILNVEVIDFGDADGEQQKKDRE